MRARLTPVLLTLTLPTMHTFADAMPPSSTATTHHLTRHYSRFPDPSTTPAFAASLTRIRALRAAATPPPSRLSELNAILSDPLPRGLDSGMYALRCSCEEASQRLSKPLSSGFLRVATRVEHFQIRQRAHVTAVVEGYLPQDFRRSIFDTFRARSERNDADAVKELVETGGTVREKYRLLWQQQWRRREALSSIGNAQGVWKWLVRFLAGVPQPLLVFAREINAPNGPTEALRMKFGGVLGELVGYAVEVNAMLVAVRGDADGEEEGEGEVGEILREGLEVYEGEVERFVELLEEVIINSPFFAPEESCSNDSTQLTS